MYKVKILIAFFILFCTLSKAQVIGDCVMLSENGQDTTSGFFDILPPYTCGESKDYAPIP